MFSNALYLFLGKVTHPKPPSVAAIILLFLFRQMLLLICPHPIHRRRVHLQRLLVDLVHLGLGDLHQSPLISLTLEPDPDAGICCCFCFVFSVCEDQESLYLIPFKFISFHNDPFFIFETASSQASSDSFMDSVEQIS